MIKTGSNTSSVFNDWLKTNVLVSNWFVRVCSVCICNWASSLLHDDEDVGVCASDDDDDEVEESIKLFEIDTWEEETDVDGNCLKFVLLPFDPDDLEFIFCSTSFHMNSLTSVGAASTNWDRIAMAIVLTFSSLMSFVVLGFFFYYLTKNSKCKLKSSFQLTSATSINVKIPCSCRVLKKGSLVCCKLWKKLVNSLRNWNISVRFCSSMSKFFKCSNNSFKNLSSSFLIWFKENINCDFNKSCETCYKNCDFNKSCESVLANWWALISAKHVLVYTSSLNRLESFWRH